MSKLKKYTVKFEVEGRKITWERFYASLADAIRDVRKCVENEYGPMGEISIHTSTFPNGWLA